MIDPVSQLLQSSPPDNLLKLFSLTKKNEVLKCSSEITVLSEELTRMIVGAHKAGYVHIPRFGDIRPPQLELMDRDVEVFGGGVSPLVDSGRQRRKTFRKIKQMFLERKVMAFHFFVAPSRWHLISFSNHDAHSAGPNHWECGTHIHFVNFLWPECDPVQIWNSFPERPSGVHIRFDPQNERTGQPVDTSNGHNQSPPSAEPSAGRG